jgi:hypothetical protein
LKAQINNNFIANVFKVKIFNVELSFLISKILTIILFLHINSIIVKKALVLLFVSLLIFTGCSIFDAQSRAKHSYLKKVPVNESVSGAPIFLAKQNNLIDIDSITPIINVENTSVSSVENSINKKENISKNNLSNKNLNSAVKLKSLNKLGRLQAKSAFDNKTQYIDPVTLLIWVLVVTVILAVLGYFIPVFLDILIFVLLATLLVLAIIFVLNNM